MYGSGALRHTTSGGLSPSSNVASLSSRYRGVVFALSFSRAKIPGNPGTLGSGDVAATLAMFLQVRCTVVRVGVGWKVDVPRACAGAAVLNRLEESSVIRLLLEIMGAVSSFGRYRPYWASIVGACYVARTLLYDGLLYVCLPGLVFWGGGQTVYTH